MQFSLRSIFLAFVVVGSALGAFGPWGLAVGVVIVALVVLHRPQRLTPLEWLVIVAIVLILAALLLPDVDAPRESSRRMQCMNNLKQIALALHNYEAVYGSLPPAYVPGPDGKPWHSWRVLILPFIEQQPLYQAYNFSEPWNGPNNSKLAASTPAVYLCPSQSGPPWPSQVTGYVAVVGPRTMWPGVGTRRLQDAKYGTSSTIMVVEAAPAGIPWMEPRDLALDDLAAPGERDPAKDPLGVHRWPESGWFLVRDGGSGVHVAFADGSVWAIPRSIPGEQLAALLTVDGGEAFNGDNLPWPPDRVRIHWPRALSLVVLVIATVLFWFSVHRWRGRDRIGA